MLSKPFAFGGSARFFKAVWERRLQLCVSFTFPLAGIFKGGTSLSGYCCTGIFMRQCTPRIIPGKPENDSGPPENRN
jgi:hypothetical protein